MHFPCPLLLTSIHFSIQWAFSHVVCACFPQSLGTDRVRNMSWMEWASISLPCGMVTALDVGLSNLALVTITLTFYTMVKSSTPVFVLGWAYLFKLERITWPLIGVVVVIAAGEFLTVYGEVNFILHGFLLCLTASVLSGARWTLVQLKLQRLDPPLKSTIVTMRLLAPSMFWSMLLISLVVERPWQKLRSTDNDADEVLRVLALGLIGGVLAIFMILCEFYLILRASAVILMIGGVVKELTTIICGIFFFGDRMNALNTTGVCIVFLGVLLYKVVFHLEKDSKRMEAVSTTDVDGEYHDGEELVQKSSSDSNDGGFSDSSDKKYDGREGLFLSKTSAVEMTEHSKLHLRSPRHSESAGDENDVDTIVFV